ncbi:MAG: N-acetylmuramoyl-L-alanine amidase [Eubacterium sp.]|nr:N-acetylmuramoyl-L-alanine amidase [Eubacterium sp.]
MLKSQNKQKNQNLKNLHNGVRFISKCSVHLLLCALLVMYMVVPVSATEVSQTEPLRFTKSVNALTAGKTYQFRVNTTDSVKWSVGNEKIAVVNKNGKVRAKRYGKTHVYATCNGEKIAVLLQVKGKKIVGIDPGHQQRGDSSTEPNGPGSSTYKAKVAGGTRGVSTGKAEYKLTLEIAKKLKTELWNRGYQVVMTRTKHDVNISNKERAQLINESGASICVRIHADGGPSSARGATALCPSSSNRYISKLYKKSKKLSDEILSAYCASTGLRNRGISYRDDLTGTNWSTVPTTLLELGFMTNATEDRYMSSETGQKAMVQGLANGIDRYFGYKK